MTSVAGMLVLALRCDRADLGDGPISSTRVVIFGIVLLALPFATAVYRAAKRTRRLTVPVAVISTAAAIAIAAVPPGNLMLMAFPLVLAPAISLVWLAEALLRRLAKPPRA